MNNEQDQYMVGSSRLVSEADSRRCEGLAGVRVGQGSHLGRKGRTEARMRSLVEAAYSGVISPSRLNIMLGRNKL